MEQDRFQYGPITYIFGMICLVLSMGFFVFSGYLAPNLLIGVTYNLPEFVAHLMQWFVFKFEVSDAQAGWYTFFLFFTMGLFTALLAFLCSNRIDNRIHRTEHFSEGEDALSEKQKSERTRKNIRDSANMILKIFLIVVVIFFVVAIIEWFLYIPPPEGG